MSPYDFQLICMLFYLHRYYKHIIPIFFNIHNCYIASFPILGAVLGSLLINKPMQYYGRKKTLIGHYLVFSSGFLLTGFTYFVKAKSMFYIGRFLMGFAAGCTSPVSQIYVIIKCVLVLTISNNLYLIGN